MILDTVHDPDVSSYSVIGPKVFRVGGLFPCHPLRPTVLSSSELRNVFLSLSHGTSSHCPYVLTPLPQRVYMFRCRSSVEVPKDRRFTHPNPYPELLVCVN